MCVAAVTARATLESSLASLLTSAATAQPDVLQQLQSAIVTLLKTVVVPQLTNSSSSSNSSGGGVLTEPGLSAISRIMKGDTVFLAVLQLSLCAANILDAYIIC